MYLNGLDGVGRDGYAFVTLVMCFKVPGEHREGMVPTRIFCLALVPQLERFESRLVALFVEELAEACTIGVFRISYLYGGSLFRKVIVRLAKVHGPDVTHGLLGCAKDPRALGHQLLCQLHHLGADLVGPEQQN